MSKPSPPLPIPVVFNASNYSNSGCSSLSSLAVRLVTVKLASGDATPVPSCSVRVGALVLCPRIDPHHEVSCKGRYCRLGELSNHPLRSPSSYLCQVLPQYSRDPHWRHTMTKARCFRRAGGRSFRSVQSALDHQRLSRWVDYDETFSLAITAVDQTWGWFSYNRVYWFSLIKWASLVWSLMDCIC